MKRRLEQKLILRGSCDFEEPAVYGELLSEVVSALNAPRQQRYEQEIEHLMALPAFRFADYELLTVRERGTSTIMDWRAANTLLALTEGQELMLWLGAIS